MTAPLSQRLLDALTERMVVGPSLRNVIRALPDEPGATPGQAEAVATLVVMNVWLFCGDAALDVLRRAEAAVGGTLALLPRPVQLDLHLDQQVAAAKLAAGACATRLGFSPLARSRVMTCADRLARALPRGPASRLEILVDTAERSVLLVATAPAAVSGLAVEELTAGADHVIVRRTTDRLTMRVRFLAGREQRGA